VPARPRHSAVRQPVLAGSGSRGYSRGPWQRDDAADQQSSPIDEDDVNLAWEVGAPEDGLAMRVERLASERWGGKKPTVLVGRDHRILQALERIARFAASDGPVLITGETGTGKELFARALYLLGDRRPRQFLSINCAQYHDGQLIASELFGHRRGAFTGAIADHRGMFEEAEGGVIFLDEIGELSPPAQAMLLRVLGEGEIVSVGSTTPKQVDVRVVAATSRDLGPMVESGAFRPDLYYRLRCFHVAVPPLRDRGNDWELIAAYYLDRLIRQRGWRKRLAASAFEVMRDYDWPGNVREVKSVVETGFHMSDGAFIEARDFVEQLQMASRAEQIRRITLTSDSSGTNSATSALNSMLHDAVTFWDAVHAPYLAHEMSRAEARAVIARGLEKTLGSYKRLVTLFNMQESEYLKFMDFLRHQRLKPNAD
jgi:transcriptional regulator with GAF, ATPase, and Fis domain